MVGELSTTLHSKYQPSNHILYEKARNKVLGTERGTLPHCGIMKSNHAKDYIFEDCALWYSVLRLEDKLQTGVQRL